MNLIRPELRDMAIRWREVLAGGALIALGAWWALGVGGILGWVGICTVIVGAATGVIGVQRVRFRSAGQGPGVVLVDEGEVTYMGPLTGGSVAIADLEMLVLDPRHRPAHWVLQPPERPALHIPVNARGADGLFDAFAGLPGIRTRHMLAQLDAGGAHPVVIWERDPTTRPARNRLH